MTQKLKLVKCCSCHKEKMVYAYVTPLGMNNKKVRFPLCQECYDKAKPVSKILEAP